LNDPITAENRKQYISDGHFFDQVSDVCQEQVQERLVSDYRLKFVTLHQDNDEASKGRIIQALVNENYNEMDNPEEDDRPTLIIMTGKGKSRAGILSVKHLLISGMEVGSASYHIEQALSRNWNVVCLDPNALGTHHGMEVLEKSLDKLLGQDSQKSLLSSSSPGGDDKVETSDIMMLSPSLCFSIIFRCDWTLDFMTLSGNPRALDSIVNALDQILQTYQEQKKKMSDNV
jgi:hypothetical protein